MTGEVNYSRFFNNFKPRYSPTVAAPPPETARIFLAVWRVGVSRGSWLINCSADVSIWVGGLGSFFISAVGAIFGLRIKLFADIFTGAGVFISGVGVGAVIKIVSVVVVAICSVVVGVVVVVIVVVVTGVVVGVDVGRGSLAPGVVGTALESGGNTIGQVAPRSAGTACLVANQSIVPGADS